MPDSISENVLSKLRRKIEESERGFLVEFEKLLDYLPLWCFAVIITRQIESTHEKAVQFFFRVLTIL